jgi:hypothetical protein
MSGKQCEEVRRLIRAAAQSGSVAAPPAELVGHIVGCATCQGGLALLLREMLGPQMPPGIGCATCQQHLAAYAELAAETNVALQTYSAVGWHLWTCAGCAEMYEMTAALLEAGRSGTLRAIPELFGAPAGRQLLAAFRLARAFLSQALPTPPPLLGAARGDEEAEGVLYETEAGAYLISVGVRRQPDQQWSLVVTIEPPASGQLSLMLDDHSSQVPISAGMALVPNLPDAALGAHEGSDLVGQIELDAPSL